jgi:hypothetical protein
MLIGNLISFCFKRRSLKEDHFMKDLYESMMLWALGDDWSSQDVKKAPGVWKLLHPELPELQTLEFKSAGVKACFYIFQMTNYWLSCHKPRSSYEQNRLQPKARTLCACFRDMFHSFRVFLSKSISRT